MDHKFELDVGNYFYESVDWLRQKCLEKNPEWRPSPQEAAIYLRLLRKYYMKTIHSVGQ
jgi:hypothetical protein